MTDKAKLKPCPFCGCSMALNKVGRDWHEVMPKHEHNEECPINEVSMSWSQSVSENEVSELWNIRSSCEKAARIAELEEEAETLRMQLAACGAVALSNTKESAAQQRTMDEKYKSASLSDVINSVDREMLLRAQLQVATEALKVVSQTPLSDHLGIFPDASGVAKGALNKIQELEK